jgi:hypothetical protein
VETIKKLAMTAIRHLNYSTGDEQQFASLQTSVVNSVVSSATSSRRDETPNKQAIAATTLLAYSQAYLDMLQSVPPPAVPASYRTEETNFAPTCFTSFEPRQSHDLSQQIETRFSNWTLQLSPFDRDAVQRNDKRHMGYLDRKYIHMSTGPGSVLALRISSVGTNVLWLCEVQKGFAKYPSSMDDLNTGAEVFLWPHYKGDEEVRLGEVEKDGNMSVEVLDRSTLTKLGNCPLQTPDCHGCCLVAYCFSVL